jgi:hypothetical protein
MHAGGRGRPPWVLVFRKVSLKVPPGSCTLSVPPLVPRMSGTAVPAASIVPRAMNTCGAFPTTITVKFSGPGVG